MTNHVTHSGWKAIAIRLGVRDVGTAKRRVEKYSIPIIRFGRNPILDESVYRAWYMKFVEISQKNDEVRNTPTKPPKNSKNQQNTPQLQ